MTAGLILGHVSVTRGREIETTECARAARACTNRVLRRNKYIRHNTIAR